MHKVVLVFGGQFFVIAAGFEEPFEDFSLTPVVRIFFVYPDTVDVYIVAQMFQSEARRFGGCENIDVKVSGACVLLREIQMCLAGSAPDGGEFIIEHEDFHGLRHFFFLGNNIKIRLQSERLISKVNPPKKPFWHADSLKFPECIVVQRIHFHNTDIESILSHLSF